MVVRLDWVEEYRHHHTLEKVVRRVVMESVVVKAYCRVFYVHLDDAGLDEWNVELDSDMGGMKGDGSLDKEHNDEGNNKDMADTSEVLGERKDQIENLDEVHDHNTDEEAGSSENYYAPHMVHQ